MIIVIVIIYARGMDTPFSRWTKHRRTRRSNRGTGPVLVNRKQKEIPRRLLRHNIRVIRTPSDSHSLPSPMRFPLRFSQIGAPRLKVDRLPYSNRVGLLYLRISVNASCLYLPQTWCFSPKPCDLPAVVSFRTISEITRERLIFFLITRRLTTKERYR